MSSLSTSTVERELRPDERLLWKGRPRGGIMFRGSDVFLIPFSLLWGGFVIFWEFTALFMMPKNNPAGWLFPLFGVPFVLAGLYIVFGRFLVDAKIRETTEYAITNRRALIVSGLFSRKIKSIELKSAPEITLVERADRSGSITFGATPYYGWWMQSNLWFPGISTQPAFDMIDNVRNVYEIIEQAKSR